jgi:PPOX class probable F420-dependent enzyme
MEIDTALEFAAATKKGVLATHKRDGRPQLSNVVFAVADGEVRISVTDGRAKTANLRRDPRASLHVTSADFWSYVVIDADVELTDVMTDPGDAAAELLRSTYRAVSGEHPDWDEFDQAMIDDRRLVVRLRPNHAYGMG